jgi:hypothetical protein
MVATNEWGPYMLGTDVMWGSPSNVESSSLIGVLVD